MDKLNEKKPKKQYLCNKDFVAEIIESKKQGELTDKAVKMFILLANKVSDSLPYIDPRDKEDCVQSALYDLLKYWKNFNPEITNNAFAFFTQIAVHGLAKEFKKIHKHKVELISLDMDGDSEIFSL